MCMLSPNMHFQLQQNQINLNTANISSNKVVEINGLNLVLFL